MRFRVSLPCDGIASSHDDIAELERHKMTDRDKADDNFDGVESRSNFGVVKERVRNLEVRVGELVDALKETNYTLRDATVTMLQATKPDYKAWLSAAALVLTFVVAVASGIWVGIIDPMKVDDEKHFVRIEAAIAANTDHMVTREDFRRMETELEKKVSKSDFNDRLFEYNKGPKKQ